MNVKNSHCMNRTRNMILALAMTIFATAPLSAQISEGSDAVLYDKYQNALRTNFWQDGSNPVGIRQDRSFERIAHAALSGNMSAGGFRQSHEASLPWSVGAHAESIVHLDKFSMQGSFSFEQMQGSDMCGSMFVNPGYYPIDALEFTPGRKIRQTYAFDGAISVDVAPQWRVGAGIDFTSANLSKRKDVRHSNYLLDMSVTPGVIWHSGNNSIGLNAVLRKTTDTPTAKQIGTKETYTAFLDKGLYYGKLEDWEGSGLHLSENGVNGLPVKEIFGGAGIQMQIGNMFMEFEYQRGNGTIGEKQYIWYRFPSHNFSYVFGQRWDRGSMTHDLRLRLQGRKMTNNESVLEKVTVGGVSTTVQHGSNQILARTDMSVRVEYSFMTDKDEFVLRSGIDERVSTVSQMYPYVTDQSRMQWISAVGYTRHAGPVDIAVGAGYMGGMVDENDRLVSEDSGVTSELLRLEDYYQMDIEYSTANRVNLGACVTYDFWKGLYAKATVDYTRAFKVTVLPGADRVSASLGIGYNF